MRRFIPLTFLFLLVPGAASFPAGGLLLAQAQPPPLRLEVVNVQKNRGKLVIALFKDKADWLKKPFRQVVLPTDKTTQTVALAMPHGTYAVSIFQDTNGNGVLDQNFLGIPKEPFGFGNNYKPLGKPDFEKAAVTHLPTSRPGAIKLYSML